MTQPRAIPAGTIRRYVRDAAFVYKVSEAAIMAPRNSGHPRPRRPRPTVAWQARQAVWLRLLGDGYPATSIARAWGVNEATVGALRWRASQKRFAA